MVGQTSVALEPPNKQQFRTAGVEEVNVILRLQRTELYRTTSKWKRQKASDEDADKTDETDESDAAADDHNDDERLEPSVIDQLVRETAQLPPLLTGVPPQRRLPAVVLPAPASRTAVVRVLDRNHRHIRHCICGKMVKWWLDSGM